MNKKSLIILSLMFIMVNFFKINICLSNEIRYYDKYIKLLNTYNIYNKTHKNKVIKDLGNPLKKFVISPCKHDIKCEYYIYKIDPKKFFGMDAKRGVNPDHIIFIINKDGVVIKIEAF